MRLSHLLVLLLLLALAVGLTYPLVNHLSTHVPGTDTWAFDEYTFLWSTWWFKTALINQHASPLQTDLLFFPLGLDLVLYTYNLLAAIIGLPLQLAGNIPLASNLINWLATILSGYGGFLLVRYLLRRGIPERGQLARIGSRDWRMARDSAALLAGLIFAFASNRAIYLSLGHYNIFSTQWTPFFILALLRALERPTRRNAALAGIFAGLALLTDMLFGVLLGLAALVLVINRRSSASADQGGERSDDGRSKSAATFRRTRRKPLARRLEESLAGRLALAVLVAALVSLPLLAPTLIEGFSGDYALEGWGDAQKLSSDLVGFVTPTDLHPLSGSDWQAELRAVETGDSRFSDINTVFLGYLSLALALLGAWAGRRQARVWARLAGLCAILALGPLLQINGQSLFDLDGLSVNLPLPFIITHYLPFIKGYRAPNRFSIPLMLSLAVLAGFGVWWISSRLLSLQPLSPEVRTLLPPKPAPSMRRRSAALGVVVLLAAGLIFEHLAWPMPLTDARVPAIFQRIADEPGDFTVMQLPTGWRNGFRVFGSEDTRVQWYQSVHRRPILSGNAVRNPPFKFEYFERQPLFQVITGLEMHQQPDELTGNLARLKANELVGLWNVRYLIVNPPVPGRHPYAETWQTARDYVLDVLPVNSQPLWEEDGIQVYAVQPPLIPFPFSLDFGSQDTSAYRGPGWSQDEPDIAGASAVWINEQDAELFLPLRFNEAQPLDLTLRILPFSYAGAPPQAVIVEFNGVNLGTRAVTAGWQELSFSAPASATRSGLNDLWLHFSESARPVDVLPGQDRIGATGLRSPLDIEINSGGAAQDFAYMSVTPPGQPVIDASAGRRGYNLTAIDPKSGKLLDVRGFDTWANEYEADRLAEFVESLPDGVIVIAAARDDASRFLTGRAVAALASLGSTVDLRNLPGQGHALIGVKGAAPGSAPETTGPEGAYLRLAADRRNLSAALDWLRLEAAR